MDELRLAWEAHRMGRMTRRDALLTLAVAASPRDQRHWTKPVVALLLASRPDHLFAGFRRIDEALADPAVASCLGRLRMTFPPARVKWLAARCDAVRGPFTGRPPSIGLMLREMTASLYTPRRLPMPAIAEATAPTFAGNGLGFPPDADPLLKFYLSTLLATATLLAVVLRDSQDMRAA